MRNRKIYCSLITAVALGWLLPALAWAQVITVASADGSYAAVEQLKQQATSLFETPARWGEAGALLEQAGRMLAVEDPAGVPLLLQAGRMQAYSGQLAKSQVTMKEAGWRALGQGDVVTAANAYADAACIAVEAGDQVAAKQLVDIVSLLSRWPGVTGAQRRLILRRI